MSNNQLKLNEQLFNVVLSENSSDEVKLKRVKYLVRLGADVNYQIYGKSLLCHAIRAKVFDEVIGFLEESGAREWKISKADAKALGNEIKNCYDSYEIIELLKQGADVDSVDNMGRCLLERGIVKGDKQLVEIVIKQGGNLNIKNSWGNTPLICAVDENKLEIAKMLIDADIDLNVSNDDGDTALILAVKRGHKKIVKMLIEKGADLNKQNNDGFTALVLASISDKKNDLVKMLVDSGADVNVKGDGGWTALMWAAYNGSKDMVQMLLEKGADVNIENNYGNRVWDGCDREIVNVIKEHIKKTGGDSYNDGGFLGKIFGGFGR